MKQNLKQKITFRIKKQLDNKRKIHQGNLLFINPYAINFILAKYIKQNLTELQGETNKSISIDFKTTSIIAR